MTDQPPIDFEKIASRLELLLQSQSETNRLLAQSINNNIKHFDALNSYQNTGTAKVISQLQDSTKNHNALMEMMYNNASWLMRLNETSLKSNDLLAQDLCKEITVNLPDTTDILLQSILDQLRQSQVAYWVQQGYIWDSKKFTFDVTATGTEHELTELEDASVAKEGYLIDELLLSSNGTMLSDASYHLNTVTGDPIPGRFVEAYYQTGSFVIIPVGAKNGRLNKLLDKKPFLTVNPGAGAAGQTIYGTVYYYHK